jgi:hypothetical protein
MIYDKSKTIELYDGDSVIIPAESLLVSIEIKTLLNKEEAKKILINANKLKNLRPFKKKPILKTRGGDSDSPHCRYFYCVFAYDSDFKTTNWAKSEYNRLLEVSKELKINLNMIDRIYVVNKGIINPVLGFGVNEIDKDVRSFMYFYSHIMNFTFRENGRRKPVPYELYSGRESQGWKRLT